MGVAASQRVLTRFDVDLTRPIDLLDLARQLGVLVQYGPLPRLAGAYVVTDAGPPGIVVNTRLPLAKQRYTLAHEIGHHVLEHGATYDADTERLGFALIDDNERAAEAFAAWLMMPRALVQHVISPLTPLQLTDAASIYQISLQLRASYAATVRHLVSNQVLTYGQSVRLGRIRPKEIKAQLLDGSAAAAGRSDVHHVGPPRAVPVTCHPGDLIVTEPPAVDFDADAFELAGPAYMTGRTVLRTRDREPANPSEGCHATHITVGMEANLDVPVEIEPRRHGVAEYWFSEDDG